MLSNKIGNTEIKTYLSAETLLINWYLIACCAANCIPVLVQQNLDGSNFFSRSWAEFKVGFGTTNGNYWIGNDRLSRLTLSDRYKLRFELQARNSSWYNWAEYSRFTVLGVAQLRASGVWLLGQRRWCIWLAQRNDVHHVRPRQRPVDKSAVQRQLCSGARRRILVQGLQLVQRQRCPWSWRYFSWYSLETGHMYLQTSRMWLTC